MQGQDFENRLKAQTDFPSPSRVAAEIVTLARDPDIEMSKVAEVVSRDPAMAAKILRIANSAYFSQRRPSQNLRQALIVIGLNAALTLALSFSLVSTFRTLQPRGVDYPRFWRRALLAATAGRAFGQLARIPHEDDLFLAGLLQDLGVLALDRVARDFYLQLAPNAGHSAWIQLEKEQLGRDHAYYTHRMLKAWNVPDRICYAIEHSHTPDRVPRSTDEGRFVRSLVAGSELAEAVLDVHSKSALSFSSRRIQRLLYVSDEELSGVITRVLELIPETELLYETSILPPDAAESLLAEARELLAVRNLQALQQVSALQATASELQSRTEEIEDAGRRDPLTGVLNRSWLERLLDDELNQSTAYGRLLSLAIVDIDHLKVVAEQHGNAAVDDVLKACAAALENCVRETDLVGRYSAGEFLVVLPGTELDTAAKVASRMLDALREVRVPTKDEAIVVTASIGVVSCTPQTQYPTMTAFLEAADHAVYTARLRGRNRVETLHEAPKAARVAGAGGPHRG